MDQPFPFHDHLTLGEASRVERVRGMYPDAKIIAVLADEETAAEIKTLQNMLHATRISRERVIGYLTRNPRRLGG